MDSRTELEPLVGSRLIRLPEVLKIVAMGKTNLYRKVADGSFPKPIRLSERQVRWALVDVLGWVAGLRPHESVRTAGTRVSSDKTYVDGNQNRRATDQPARGTDRRTGDRRRV